MYHRQGTRGFRLADEQDLFCPPSLLPSLPLPHLYPFFDPKHPIPLPQIPFLQDHTQCLNQFHDVCSGEFLTETGNWTLHDAESQLWKRASLCSPPAGHSDAVTGLTDYCISGLLLLQALTLETRRFSWGWGDDSIQIFRILDPSEK